MNQAHGLGAAKQALLNLGFCAGDPEINAIDAAMTALQFYQDAWEFKDLKRPGLEWKPKEDLLDDCGNRARAALRNHGQSQL